jgi:ABC-2 type transport system permease protein
VLAFFYFINGLRHAMIGFSEVPGLGGAAITLALAALLMAIVWLLFAVGWGLRD